MRRLIHGAVTERYVNTGYNLATHSVFLLAVYLLASGQQNSGKCSLRCVEKAHIMLFFCIMFVGGEDKHHIESR